MNKNTLWLLEDDEMTQMVVSTSLLRFAMAYKLQTVSSATEINARPGDIILCDQQGVNIERLQTNGALVVSMSGNKNLIVDLYKPFKTKDLEQAINSKLDSFNKRAA